jgi:hypothetical protein
MRNEKSMEAGRETLMELFGNFKKRRGKCIKRT